MPWPDLLNTNDYNINVNIHLPHGNPLHSEWTILLKEIWHNFWTFYRDSSLAQQFQTLISLVFDDRLVWN